MATHSSDKFVGGVMVASSILAVAAMAHHPSNSSNVALANIVHGTMMALTLLLFGGFARFAARRGFDSNPNLFAFIAYAAGTFGNLLAGTINGFAVPALAARGAVKDVFAFAWELNQALAYGAVYAFSIAFVLWGADMVRRGPRLVGAAGVVAGLAPAALLSTGALDMHVAGAFVVYAVELAFSLLIGLTMMFSKLAPARGAANS